MSSNLRATYNRIASDFSTDHQHDTWDDDHIQRFAELLPQTASMLDLGCGPAWELARLRRPGLIQTGFDLSDELLAIAKRNNPDATFVQGDMRKLPFADGSFDGVFAKASLLHIEKRDIPTVLSEIHRVLKADGIVHIALKKIREGQAESELKTENDYGYDYERFFSYWTMPELLTALQQARFTIREHEDSPSPSGRTIWLKVIAKK